MIFAIRKWIRTVLTAVTAGSLGAASFAVVAGAAEPAAASNPVTAAGTAPLTAYSLLTTTGKVIGFGGAFSGTVTAPASPVVGVAPTADGHGAYAVEADGEVATLGNAVARGSMAGVPLVAPVVGVALDPANGGYWMVAADGGVFTFGGAPWFGSQGGQPLAEPVVAMAAMPDGGGYWLVASDGGIFTFGSAKFYGSTGSMHLDKPVVGMAATPDGGGYWLVASDGGIFAFGDAAFYGSMGAQRLDRPVIAMSATADGRGYWMVASDGGMFAFGDAPFYGSGFGTGATFVGMAPGAADNYQNPMRSIVGLTPMRVDEGVDYGGYGPIYALGRGVVTSTTGPWPGGAFITYRLTAGPATGKMVYVAENVTPNVTVGQTVDPSTIIGVLHNAYPYMETGWAADSYGDTMAAQAGQWTAADDANSLPAAFGVNFNQLLVSLGAPSGVMVHPSVVGALPVGWPTW